jgi:hypothetical protein
VKAAHEILFGPVLLYLTAPNGFIDDFIVGSRQVVDFRGVRVQGKFVKDGLIHVMSCLSEYLFRVRTKWPCIVYIIKLVLDEFDKPNHLKHG